MGHNYTGHNHTGPGVGGLSLYKINVPAEETKGRDEPPALVLPPDGLP